MDNWENKIKQAQFAFEKQQFDKAIKLSGQALTMASRAFSQVAVGDIQKAIATIVISYFSLADGYLAIESHDKVLRSYQNCLSFVIKANDMTSSSAIDHSVAIAMATVKIDEKWQAFKQQGDQFFVAKARHSIEKFERELKRLRPYCCQKDKQNIH
ncbi:hypothetical protein J7384_00475 [Endozoicomonas sp. G2_1]|uniref:hypothetical protein n=1 Tax=Endozoicomonas sp. G2_1 TaxID=2821091 RepID=UPI001ADCC40D|nr:hypothetical protein [Endozoicomonas sp. G2_1]MBO9488829.1 hypothetical protein [Endozoicomonas sp. G2_1]